MKNQFTYKKILQNKYANHQYFIIKKIETGISLLGWEVKSIRAKKIAINQGYITIKEKKEAYLHNIIITPLISSHIINNKYNTTRTRKLLLKKNELQSLLREMKHTKKTIIPLEIYWKNNWIKLIIALAQGKKTHDKREEIKKREWILDKKHILN